MEGIGRLDCRWSHHVLINSHISVSQWIYFLWKTVFNLFPGLFWLDRTLLILTTMNATSLWSCTEEGDKCDSRQLCQRAFPDRRRQSLLSGVPILKEPQMDNPCTLPTHVAIQKLLQCKPMGQSTNKEWPPGILFSAAVRNIHLARHREAGSPTRTTSSLLTQGI